IDELAALVDPIPGITDATYVPSAAELQAIEGILSAMSGSPDEAAR
ncbi:MAG: hypothetical protein GWN71_35915, partial [Gammaproteobacteria bacterium]|nr:hypothetical protein [Gemmatimonadota bacterium]NIU78749.1 hypothetical protein [Gammaproteobacteria bacterium]NIX24325.1 hypothetical protein [Actinomycetota bacterium]